MRSMRTELYDFKRNFMSKYALLKIAVYKSTRMKRNGNDRKT